jgi:BirA family biotin operon repressor/biotin-[acetyl-CoA-carboxylase] ligase
VQYSIIGIGVNLNVELNNYPDIVSMAVSLSDVMVGRVSAALFSQRLLMEFENLYLSGSAVFTEWQNSLITLGKNVTATSGDMFIEGVAESVNPDGSLIIKQTGGNLFKAVAGEVTLRI